MTAFTDLIDLAAERLDLRVSRPLVLPLDKLHSIATLLVHQHFRCSPRQLAFVVRADAVRRSTWSRPVKEQNHP